MGISRKSKFLISFLLSSAFFLYFITSSLSSQLSFLMELGNPVFNLTQNALNNTNTAEDIIFSGNENQTRWISIPKNSTILFSNISLAGIMKPTKSSTVQLVYWGLAIGNVTTSQENEIAIGVDNYIKMLNNTGGQIWSYSITGTSGYGVSIGNLSSDSGNEVAAGTTGGYVFALNSSGSQSWNKSIGATVYDVAAVNSNITNEYDEIAVAAGNNILYLLDSSGNTLWSYGGSSSFRGVSIGNLSSDTGNEIATGTTAPDDSVYVLNSGGQLKWNKTLGTGINDVATGDVNTGNEYDEIAVAGSNGTVFLLDYTGSVLWTFTTGAEVDTVTVGDVTTDILGSEVVVGSNDYKVYVLNYTGGLVWSYTTENYVRGVGVGNLTADSGNEVAAGINLPATYTLYILNFEYYPTNATLDIGDNGSIEWQYPGKFRTNSSVSNDSAFQGYLTSCTSGSNGKCDIPLIFHSDYGGDLNITSINITYQYNISNLVSYQEVGAWSRTANVRVNESVGNQVRNITYSGNPAVDIRFDYIRIDDTATRCDFNGTSYSNTTSNGKNVCDISSLNHIIPSSGSLPYDTLWDDSLTEAVPIYINETNSVTIGGFWKKNLTIWNNTPEIFYGIIANTTINDTVVISEPKLKVDWFGNTTLYDITPSAKKTDCNSTSPTYESIAIGADTFYVCKQDTNGNDIEDLFVWKQPNSSTVMYEASGSGNNPPALSAFNITPSSGIWGSNFSINVNVSDVEQDNVTVRLWVNITNLNVWELVDSKNATENQTITFNITTNKSWVGSNLFKFEFTDFNYSGEIQYHDWANTSEDYGPNVTKHNVTITHVQGNDTSVNRTSPVYFSIQINDTDSNSEPASDANCTFWVSTNGANWDSGYNTSVNQTGYCDYTFTPNASYSPGARWWKAGTYQDPYYQENISSNFSVNIHGQLSIDLAAQNLTRSSSYILAAIYDEFGSLAPINGYNCAWYVNNTFKNNSETNSSGYCGYDWTTNCSDSLGYYPISAILSGSSNPYYYLNITNSTGNSALKDNLNLTIISPASNSIYHIGDTIFLNSTLNDSCGVPSYSYTVNWGGNSTTDSGWPTCSMNKTGDNTSYVVDSNCAPSILLIKSNATGEFYNLQQRNVSVKIYGWSGVNVTYPENNQMINRTESQRVVTLVCYVKDANMSLGIERYPVKIWDRTGSGESLLYQGETNNSGYVSYPWNISDNETVPEGSHTIKCNITDTNVSVYRNYNASTRESSVDIIIREYDTTPPNIKYLNATSVMPGNNVTIEANVTDWYGVDKVWINVTFPNSSSFAYQMQNTTPDTIQTSWRTIINVSLKGDYDFVLYTNDTSGGVNSSTSWFEVYEPIQMYLNATYPVDFTFYRPGRTDIVHTFYNGSSSSKNNFTLHKRDYDFVARIEDDSSQIHSVEFGSMNSTNTSELIYGSASNNITNPLNLSIIPLTLVDPPVPSRHELSAILVTQNMSFSNVTITLNYSNKINEIDYEPAIKIYKCNSWASNSCTSGWEAASSQIDTQLHTVSLNSTTTSVFYSFEAETCGNGKCGSGESCSSCSSDCGTCGTSNQGSTGGTTSGGYVPITPSTVEETKFSIRTNLTDAQINVNESKIYAIWITNDAIKRLNFSISITGSIASLLQLEKKSLSLDPTNESLIQIHAFAPQSIDPGTYTGQISIKGNGKTQMLPVTISVSIKGLIELDITVEALTKQVAPQEISRFRVMLYNLGVKRIFDANITYMIKERGTEKVISSVNEVKPMQSSYESFVIEIPISANTTLGSYLFVAEAKYDGKIKTSTDVFAVTKPFWTYERIQIIATPVLVAISVVSAWYGRKKYKQWKVSKARYIFPINMGKLPKGSLWLGKVAETGVKATFDMEELTTHLLVAGATGSGKSLTGSIFAEELLEKKIPIVVFDPTAQWTGFVRPCTDPKVLKFYKVFGLSEDDKKPFKGMIYEVTTPKIDIDFKKYMNPGEITVFTLNKLQPGEYDEAVTTIIDTIFRQDWEESPKLRLIIIFDEVHRLLEKYGGKGGYIALEKACREFRKWGIGMIMISQVLSDFKEAIKGNVLTEVQMHTKGLEDLGRIEKKYGLDYTKRVAREEVGVGMIQNPRYNDGVPWFISFRPPLHMPHKILDKDMKTYKEFSKALEEIEVELAKLEKAGINVFEMKTEFKLAKEKLKEGRFSMAEIYITSLKKKLTDTWIEKFGEGKKW